MSDSKNSEIVGILPGELERTIERLRDDGWNDLDPLKRAFAISYSYCNSHVEAAREIGKAGQGLKFLRDPFVRALIADMQAELAKISIINRSFVEQKMLETLEKLEGNVPVPMVTMSGDSYEEHKFHSGEVVTLLRDMGKIAQIVPKDDGPVGGVNIQINLGAMVGSDKEEENDDHSGVIINNSSE